MKMYVMKANGRTETVDVKPGDLEIFQKAVDGYIETVPFMNRIVVGDGTLQKGVAFCNEEGKLHGLPINELATRQWVHRGGDVLVGDVIFLYGTQAELDAL